MSISMEVRAKVLNNFRLEVDERIQEITAGLIALEQEELDAAAQRETLDSLFRAVHNLKGAARAVDATTIKQLAHALEDVLDAMRQGRINPTTAVFTACYEGLDAIEIAQASYEAGELAPPPQTMQALNDLVTLYSNPANSAPAPPKPNMAQVAPAPIIETAKPDSHAGAPAAPTAAADETIRVSVRKLDALMAQLSELLITKIRVEQRLKQIYQLQDTMTAWQEELFVAGGAHNYLPGMYDGFLSGDNGDDRTPAQWRDFADATQARLRTALGAVNDLARQYADDTMHMALAIDTLEDEVKRTRMLPLNTITGSFKRMVRDLAQEAGKEAILHIRGGDTELDKHVLEQLHDPLIHLLRNAIDHGIDFPADRKAVGKPERGTITLSARQSGNDVVVAVSDDGQGLNLDAIRHAAARQGLAAQTLSEAELKEFIFSPGVSTSEFITDISGRGVGLDIVRRHVEALHGRIDVDSTPNAGTTFTLSLPLTLTSSRGLLVRVADELFAVPLNAIDRILQIAPVEIATLEGREVIRYNAQPLSLTRLNDVLELPREPEQPRDAHLPVLVLAAAERRMGFIVDELVGEQEVVIKGLGKQMRRVGGIAGATVLGSGKVVLILNVADLIKMAARGTRRAVVASSPDRAARPPARRRQRILIVDDSITTRTLEKNILEAAGYVVALATDGQEALNTVNSGDIPDLIVSDVAMPRVNGFELTRRLKSEPRTAEVPLILVTSLDSPTDKARGIEVGADAYIVKSTFDQRNLLETIAQLI